MFTHAAIHWITCALVAACLREVRPQMFLGCENASWVVLGATGSWELLQTLQSSGEPSSELFGCFPCMSGFCVLR